MKNIKLFLVTVVMVFFAINVNSQSQTLTLMLGKFEAGFKPIAKSWNLESLFKAMGYPDRVEESSSSHIIDRHGIRIVEKKNNGKPTKKAACISFYLALPEKPKSYMPTSTFDGIMIDVVYVTPTTTMYDISNGLKTWKVLDMALQGKAPDPDLPYFFTSFTNSNYILEFYFDPMAKLIYVINLKQK